MAAIHHVEVEASKKLTWWLTYCTLPKESRRDNLRPYPRQATLPSNQFFLPITWENWVKNNTEDLSAPKYSLI